MNRFLPFRLAAGTLLLFTLAACGDDSAQNGTKKGAPPAPQVTVALPGSAW